MPLSPVFKGLLDHHTLPLVDGRPAAYLTENPGIREQVSVTITFEVVGPLCCLNFLSANNFHLNELSSTKLSFASFLGYFNTNLAVEAKLFV